ncbi:F0F1 ATP synthase subunit B [Lacrimispora saccharolytica]|uniref:ATP synthase subunit b n=1 Tax=Lacrimispora saccharolytica (strain ATCC 35040 / DSM 2544 / NRCC 2533 / WM1) TaxID=610130 RepID=D9R1I8_LACSW|nr:F0F1 ATP synthase subunit B [Lacrimispora saccharolytica]ADL06511.1 ATP synthase F0, B subunit [[Clostridium] saccharolyticum WM1]QRV19407.1 F0F1 ATP synthase subunit B [Lacrimispora saccharolytica]
MERLLGFDPQLLFDSFITGVNIFILFFALSYMLFNPVREALERRKQKIAGELKSAADDKEAAHAMKEEYEARLQEVKKEAEAILEDARKRAKQREAEIIAEAREEADRIVIRGNREVELERKKALDDMKDQIISIASLMAGKVVAASIDTTVQNALIDETLKEMGESTWQS